MNVIGSRPDGWWRDRPAAMAALVARVEAWVPDGDQVTVVLEHPPARPIRSARIDIGHAPAAAPNSGDDEIVRLVSIDQCPGELTVVTSDSALAGRVKAAGAAVYPSSAFRSLLDGSAQ